MGAFQTVRKRNGWLVPFDFLRIVNAIAKALEVTQEGGLEDAQKIADSVVKELRKEYPSAHILNIEEIQDAVEEQLILADYAKTAKSYILYRQERAQLREAARQVPEHVKKLAEDSKKYFKNPLSEFIYYRTYSRWIESEDRRETWIETVNRYMDFMKESMGDKLTAKEYGELREGILKQEAMPSMRLLWSAGSAARKTNVAGYNCSYVAPTKLRDFSEIMYILMCGAGVGFSVEQQTVQQLPQIKPQTGKKLPAHMIKDSKEGWADALHLGLETWYGGKDIDFDFSELRPAGARLFTMGGKSSGPAPLKAVLIFARTKILSNQNRRLKPIDVHDLVCKIGEVVVMGGVRRSALISLSDLDDQDMRDAKKGQFYLNEPQRSMANNSTVYSQKPSGSVFLDEWIALAKSGTGERGIFNRGSLEKQVPKRRWKMFGKKAMTTGSNPCGEIILRSKEFCNLSEVVARPNDTEETLLKKVRLAAILGTYQSTLTNFPYLSKEWKQNCEEERLLGVSITGQWDCPILHKDDGKLFKKLRDEAVEVNKEYSKRFGVNASASVTCVKPSGTVSQLVDASSGLHTRHAQYYIRRVRIAATDSLFKMLKDQKMHVYPEVGQEANPTTYVLEFPVKASAKAVFRNDLTALQQLEYWQKVKENFTEHNPSITVSVGNDEWISVVNWLYERWDMIGGLSFLPREEHVYELAPYQEITKDQYEAMVEQFPDIDFSKILLYEKDDETQGAKELACVGGVCEIQL